MKLRTKLTALSILLIVLAVAICCTLILTFAWQSELQGVTEAGLADYNRLYEAFVHAAVADLPTKPTVRRSFLIAKFRALDGARAFSLRAGDDFLYNNLGFDVERLLAAEADSTDIDDRTVQYKTARVNGADYFLVHGMLSTEFGDYDISLARDMTAATDGIRRLAVKCIAAGLSVMALAAAVMWLIVWQALTPIQRLKAGAAQLGQGRYENRIAMQGNDELAELAKDFNSMADAVEANVRQLHERAERQQLFINDLSHELKTPVTSILLNAETLLNRKLPPQAAHRALERIFDQGTWLETLSQKLMTLVLLQGDIPMQTESVPMLLDAVRAATEQALAAQGMALTVDCTMDTLEMDFDLMRSALVNLVENARKASQNGQTIALCAHAGVIAVTDCGSGIPKAELARVTEPFYMVDRSRSKRHGGTGLGLALVARIAAAHGAALSVESAVGEGTTVRLTFPPRA